MATDDLPPWSDRRCAVENGALDEVRDLLAAGDDLNEQYPGDGMSLLHLAVDAETDAHTTRGRPYQHDMIRLLVDAGIDRSVRDRWGRTAEEFARYMGDEVGAQIIAAGPQ